MFLTMGPEVDPYSCWVWPTDYGDEMMVVWERPLVRQVTAVGAVGEIERPEYSAAWPW